MDDRIVSVESTLKNYREAFSNRDFRVLSKVLQLFFLFLTNVQRNLIGANAEHADAWAKQQPECDTVMYQRCRILRNLYDLLIQDGLLQNNPFDRVNRVKLKKPIVRRLTDDVSKQVRQVMQYVTGERVKTGNLIWMRRELMLSLIVRNSFTPTDLEFVIIIEDKVNRSAEGETFLFCSKRNCPAYLLDGHSDIAKYYIDLIRSAERSYNDSFLVSLCGKQAPVKSTMLPIDLYRCVRKSNLSPNLRYSDFKNLLNVEAMELDHYIPMQTVGDNSNYYHSVHTNRYSPDELCNFVNVKHPITSLRAF